MSPSRMHATSREARLAALREQVRDIESAGRAAGRSRLPLGIAEVDGALAGGGLAVGVLHEAAPASPALGDEAAASLFLAALAARLSRTRDDRTVLWALARRDL